MQGRDLLMLLQKASKVSGGALLLQTLQGIDEPGGTHLDLPRCRKPGFSALLNLNVVLGPEVPENCKLYSADNIVTWTFDLCG